MIVTDVARQSFVGRTAALVTGSKGKGHFKIVMDSIGNRYFVVFVFRR
jgi:H+-transporting ATPase